MEYRTLSGRVGHAVVQGVHNWAYVENQQGLCKVSGIRVAVQALRTRLHELFYVFFFCSGVHKGKQVGNSGILQNFHTGQVTNLRG